MGNKSCANCYKFDSCQLRTDFHDLGIIERFGGFFESPESLHDQIERLVADECIYYEYTDRNEIKECR